MPKDIKYYNKLNQYFIHFKYSDELVLKISIL